MKAILTQLFLYPLKSGAGLSVTSAELTESGLKGDREWMIIDETGSFVTQRQMPSLGLIVPEITESGVKLHHGNHSLEISRSEIAKANQVKQVRIWYDVIEAYDCGDDAAAFLGAALGQNRGRTLRLVQKKEERPFEDGKLFFADGFPLLVTNEQTLRELQAQLGLSPYISMVRFRPNIVIDGIPAFAEDHIQSIESDNGFQFSFVKPCERCVIIMIDPLTGKKSAEPMATLRKIRKQNQADAPITFGQNAVVTGGVGSTLRVGECFTSSY